MVSAAMGLWVVLVLVVSVCLMVWVFLSGEAYVGWCSVGLLGIWWFGVVCATGWFGVLVGFLVLVIPRFWAI